jgi:hypothetical protein
MTLLFTFMLLFMVISFIVIQSATLYFEAHFSIAISWMLLIVVLGLRSVTQGVSRVLRDQVRPRPGVNRALSDIR